MVSPTPGSRRPYFPTTFGRLNRTGKRDKIFIATKFGFVLGKQGIIDGRPEYVKAAAELSLKKLGVNFIDLYYLHVCPHRYLNVLIFHSDF